MDITNKQIPTLKRVTEITGKHNSMSSMDINSKKLPTVREVIEITGAINLSQFEVTNYTCRHSTGQNNLSPTKESEIIVANCITDGGGVEINIIPDDYELFYIVFRQNAPVSFKLDGGEVQVTLRVKDKLILYNSGTLSIVADVMSY